MSDDLKDAVLAAFGDDDSKKPAPQEETAAEAVEETAVPPAGSPAKPAPAFAGKGGKAPLSRGKGGLAAPRVAATQASKVAPLPAGATTARPPAGSTGVHSAAAATRPTAIAAAAAPARNGSNNVILLLLLLINLALVVLCGGMLAKISGLNARLVAIETKVVQTFQAADRSSKIHAGVSYLGPNKRPQKYMMVVKYDEKGSPQFDQEVFRPVED